MISQKPTYVTSSTVYARHLYKNVKRITGDKVTKDAVLDMVLDNKPVIFEGWDSEGDGHAFNIDGYLYQKRWHERYSSQGTFLSSGTDYRELFHCNFGYDGRYNGYYYFGLFDLQKGAEEVENEEQIKHNPNITDYTKDFKMIIYELL